MNARSSHRATNRRASRALLAVALVIGVGVVASLPDAPLHAAADPPDLDWVVRAGSTLWDIGNDVAVDRAGDVVVVGTFKSTVTFGTGADQVTLTAQGVEDAFIAKYSSTGTLRWAVAASTGDAADGTAVSVDGARNVVVLRAGHLAKYSPGGTLLWESPIPGTAGTRDTDLAIDGAGNIAVTGTFEGTVGFGLGVSARTLTSAGDGDIFLAKYDPAGTLVFARRAGGANPDAAYGVAADAAGNFYVVGELDEIVDPWEPRRGTQLLAKHAPSGDVLWVRYAAMDVSPDTGFRSVAVDPSGYVVLTGGFSGTMTFGVRGDGVGDPVASLTSTAFSADLLVARYSSSGSFRWARQSNGTGSTYGRAIATDSSGNVVVAGAFGGSTTFGSGTESEQISSTKYDIVVASYSTTGSLRWVLADGGPLQDFANGVAVDPKGGVLVTGEFGRSFDDLIYFETATFGSGPASVTLRSAGDADIFLARYGESGSSPPPAEEYVALSPARLLDTRADGVTVDGKFQAGGIRPAGSTLTLPVTGRGGVPSDAEAVVVNVTSAQAQATGYVTVFPCGTTLPNASNLNVQPGVAVPNLVVAKVGTGGTVCLYTYAAMHLIADVNGFVPVGSPYVALPPARLLDTRADGVTVDGKFQAGGIRPAGSTLTLPVTGRGGVPSDAEAVVVNVTSAQAQATGYVTVFPCGTTLPNASNLNFQPGVAVPNLVVAKVGAGGAVCLYTYQATQLIVDVNGYHPPVSEFAALDPARLLDTRADGVTVDGRFQGTGIRPAGSTLTLTVTGRGGVPAEASAVVLNVTATQAVAVGYVTVFPCGTPRPNASNVNFRPGLPIPNAAIAKVGTGGAVCLYTHEATHLIVDVNGYYP